MLLRTKIALALNWALECLNQKNLQKSLSIKSYKIVKVPHDTGQILSPFAGNILITCLDCFKLLNKNDDRVFSYNCIHLIIFYY